MPAFSRILSTLLSDVVDSIVVRDYDSTIDPTNRIQPALKKKKKKKRFQFLEKILTSSSIFLASFRYFSFVARSSKSTGDCVLYSSISYRANGPCERSLFVAVRLLPRIIARPSVRMNLHDFSIVDPNLYLLVN